MKFNIRTELYCAPTSEVDIPGIGSWDDIKEWFVKWNTLHYTLNGEDWLAIDMGDFNLLDETDAKRPIETTVYDESRENELDNQ